MKRKPDYNQIEELLKHYLSCNSRIIAPLIRFLLNFYDREEIKQMLRYKASSFDYLLDKHHNYYIIRFNYETKKIEVFDLLKMKIERTF